MNTVLFSHPRESLPSTSLLPDKIDLFSQLEERGVAPYLTFGAEGAFYANGAEVHTLTDEHSHHKAGSVALESVGMIVNRLDRSVKYDQLPAEWREATIPVVNENPLRSLVYRKQRVQEEVLEPLGMGMESTLVETIEDVAEFLEQSRAQEYIAKPNSGTFSKGVVRLARDEVMSYFSEHSDLLGSTLLQPAYDFSIPFADTLRSYDAASLDDFNQWSRSHATKELRMYGFHADGKTSTFPVARAMHNGEDNWFFVDPSSLPEELATDTVAVFDRAAKLTGSRAVHGALDIGYGAKANEEPSYQIVELNGRMPYLVGSEKHAAVSHKLRGMYADMIADVVNGKV